MSLCTQCDATISLEKLIPNPLSKFPVEEDSAYKDLLEDLRRYGQKTNLLVRLAQDGDAGYVIISGHRRAKALKELGLETARITLIAPKTESEEIAMIALANVGRRHQCPDGFMAQCKLYCDALQKENPGTYSAEDLSVKLQEEFGLSRWEAGEYAGKIAGVQLI